MVSWMEEVHDPSDVRADIAELRHQMEKGLAELRVEIRDAKYDLIKWSFVFWVSAVLSIAALARVLR